MPRHREAWRALTTAKDLPNTPRVESLAMSMNDCPVELLDMIVERVSSDKGLRNLRAVDRTFCALATPRAFRQVYVTNCLPSALGLKALMDCDKLAKTVERIVFRWSQPSGNSAAWPCERHTSL
ncbi:hypothetical protein OH77DRAFT_500230 [Trametes cingulata]|nr:hypothetical protein OH77DRAFT_500230 [Trametes cingulata]